MRTSCFHFEPQVTPREAELLVSHVFRCCVFGVLFVFSGLQNRVGHSILSVDSWVKVDAEFDLYLGFVIPFTHINGVVVPLLSP